MARIHRSRGCRGGRQANPRVDQARSSGGSGRDEANPSGAEAGNRNGHDYDDHSRVGQSQPADQSQAGLPLAEEPAALLWKEFEVLDIHVRHAEPVFPPHPGYGAAGTPCVVRANCFLGRLVDEGMKSLHQYNVTISLEPTTKGAYREVMTKLVSENQHKELGGRFPAYDGHDSLFIAGALPFGTRVFEVTLSAGDNKRMDRKYKVVINHSTTISLLQPRMLLAGYPTDILAQALQVLETVLRDVLFNERNDIERVPIGTNDHTLGVEAWKGLYQSIRSTKDSLSLIADVSSSVFVQPLLLIDFVQKILKIDVVDRNLTEPDYDKLLKALRGVKIEVTHRGNKRLRYRIAGLSVKTTNDLSFESPSGATKTVIDHFRERYSWELKYKSLPCIDVGSEQKPIYLPVEVCKIVPRQCYQKKLEGSQVSTLRKSASIDPEPEQSSRQVVDRKCTKRSNEFGIEFDDNLTTVDARVLLPPNLKYHDSGSQKTWFPMNGYWNMKDKDFANLKLPIFTARRDQVEHDIRICYQEAQNKLRDQKIDLLLAILPDENGSLYGNIKRICETDIGLVSQCCRRSNVFTKSNQILASMAIKINAKAGGRNSVFDDVRKSLPVVSNKPTIIAHVSHPSAVDDSAAPCIASVVASQDWHEVSKYIGVVRPQGHCEEIISGLENIVKGLLHAFEKESNKKPQQLIFYRDGISNGQFKQVVEKEIPEIEKAWKALYDNEKPQITFIVVQKKRLRLFPMDNKYKLRSATKKIVEPGTVVDSEICHPAEFNFFLCSHAEMKGTRRPVQYLVLRDDNNFKGDELQALTNNLCHTYASGIRSVSIVPPAYYAQKLTQRARVYLAQSSDTASASSSGSAAAPAPAPGGGPKQLPVIKDELKRSMFYC